MCFQKIESQFGTSKHGGLEVLGQSGVVPSQPLWLRRLVPDFSMPCAERPGRALNVNMFMHFVGLVSSYFSKGSAKHFGVSFAQLLHQGSSQHCCLPPVFFSLGLLVSL